ncbi:3D domain-containing protein [Clostridioides difficile]|uniref:3D domain-containing protein n=1 Tax=Clostridioides difficile TaxID=1496 RepID=UPI000D1F8D44|nr:3D domain-containing protein [Clostridioides difficile]HBE9444566.1 3D domain-containing protein [Clostridioides difficile]
MKIYNLIRLVFLSCIVGLILQKPDTLQAIESTSETDTLVVKHVIKKDVLVSPNTFVSTKKLEVSDTTQLDNLQLKELGNFVATAYCPCKICCEQWASSPDDKITSIGVAAYQGNTVAVDPKIIPYGTKLYIEGLGVLIATDCGGAIKGNRLDIYYSTHAECDAFGKKTVKVFKVEE